jgi:tRNA(Ile)-lysidine synthase
VLIREVARAVARLELGGAPVLVAVSGGIDSTALLHALHELCEEQRLNLSIGHVNHALRGDQSEADEAAVRALGEQLGLPIRVARVDPPALRRGRSSRERPTLQEAARTLRYRALRAMAEAAGSARIATAHTADDQAETVLLRLLRGTGPDGLVGIPARSPDGRVVRPLLGVTRSEVEAFARERGLRWREDPSNQHLEYARNRLRQCWLPGLARDFNPRLLRAIGSLAEAQQRDSEWIWGQVEREAASRFAPDGAWLRIDAKDWASLPEAFSRRLALRALRLCGTGRHVSRVQLERMIGFLCSARTATYIELPGRLRLVRDRRGFRLGPRPAAGDPVDGLPAC